MYLLPDRIQAPQLTLPAGKRVPFGWPALPIASSPGSVTRLYWNAQTPLTSSTIRLRLTAALDSREDVLIRLFSLESNQVVGSLDVRFAHVLQIFEVLLNLKDALLIAREGLGLEMIKGSVPFWIFAPSSKDSITTEDQQERCHLPHMYLQQDTLDPDAAFRERINSLASIQQFSWMEGCVLDGLMDLGYTDRVNQHLSFYFDKQQRLIYEDPKSFPSDGKFYGIESTLPLALLAQLLPKHPIIQTSLEFMRKHTDPNGIIKDGDTLSAEGSYTIAYPLASFASVYQDSKLAEAALKQLRVRREHLRAENNIFLRRKDDGSRTFTNWGRAFVWYALGLIRTVRALKHGGLLTQVQEEECIQDFVEVIQIALSYKNGAGLWYCYLDAPESGVDTSATAGLAAAILLGVNEGYLPISLEADMTTTLQSLSTYLTPDGFMTGTAQSNKDGERLQRSGYRVISQMTMGLYAQCLSAYALMIERT
jgi:unsaturated rhamnogalacturonyl hydrolase